MSNGGRHGCDGNRCVEYEHQPRQHVVESVGGLPRLHSQYHHLPSEIIYKILCHLPTKSLVRFQSVRKNWQNLVKDPSFIIDFQLTNRVPNKPCTFIVAHIELNESSSFALVEKTECGYIATNKIPIKYKFQTPEGPATHIQHPKIVSSCNGLFCIDDDHSIFVYNPITGESIALPGSKKKFDKFKMRSIYLGFDITTRKYKVARFYANWDPDNPDDSFKSGEIITLGDTSWRTLNLPRESPKYRSIWVSLPHSVFLEGAFHWLIGDSPKHKYVLSLDIYSENFQVIKLPDMMMELQKMEIINVGTSVALIGNFETQTYIWKLVDRKKGSWSALYQYKTPKAKTFSSSMKSRHQPLLMPTEHNLLMNMKIREKYSYFGFQQLANYDSRYYGRFEVLLGLPQRFEVFPFVPNFVSLKS